MVCCRSKYRRVSRIEVRLWIHTKLVSRREGGRYVSTYGPARVSTALAELDPVVGRRIWMIYLRRRAQRRVAEGRTEKRFTISCMMLSSMIILQRAAREFISELEA